MVPYNYIERYERKELTCVYCGFTLDVQKLWETPKINKGYALIAEDSKYVKDIIISVLKSKKISKEIMSFVNGFELVTAYSKLLSDKALIDIVIIDLNMPIMDGITAARTIRAIETQHGVTATPIVFFSAAKADDSLKAQIELLSPASYMNKGSDPHPDRLAERVEQLVGYLIEMYAKNSPDIF